MFDAEDKDVELDEELDEDELDLDDEDDDIDDEDPEKDDEDEDTEGDQDKDDKEDPDKKEDYKKKFLRERAMRKRAEEKLKKSPEKKEDPAPAKKTETNKEEEARSKEDRFDFRLDNPQFKSKEVDHIERLAQAYGISMREAAKLPAVKVWLDQRLKKRRLLAASASGSVSSKGTLQKNKVNFETMSQGEFEQHMRKQEGR